MNSLPEPVGIAFEAKVMKVTLDDGRTIAVPLDRYPLLLDASDEQRIDVWLSPGGAHWDELDEGISVQGMLAVSTDAASRRAA